MQPSCTVALGRSHSLGCPGVGGTRQPVTLGPILQPKTRKVPILDHLGKHADFPSQISGPFASPGGCGAGLGLDSLQPDPETSLKAGMGVGVGVGVRVWAAGAGGDQGRPTPEK